MQKKQKYYVVWKGRETGVFSSWDECKKSVKGFEDAMYKSFDNLQMAQRALSENPAKHIYTSVKKSSTTTLPVLDSISVDAACSGNPGTMEYQGVDTHSKKVIFKKGPFTESTNNIGEFLALVHALAHMKQIGDTRPIYSDSKTAMSWVHNKKCKTTLEKTASNKQSFDLIERALRWLENNTYTNELLKWNTKQWGEIPADFGRK